MPTLQSITIRMYYTGFGDCFLLTFRYSDNSAKTLWIDFGARSGKADRMRVIARHLKQYLTDAGLTRNGKPFVDVLAITHEHQDHISGFKQAAAELGLDDENPANDPLDIGQVWFAWTEDLDNDLAKVWRTHKQKSRLSLQKATQQVAAMAAAPAMLVSRLGMLAGFEFAAHEPDDDTDEQDSTTGNAQQLNFDFALHNSYEALIAKVGRENVHYLRPGHTDADKTVHPGDIIGKMAGSVQGATVFPGTTLFVLGPPEDLKIIRAGDPEWSNSLRADADTDTFGIGESHFSHADKDPAYSGQESFWYYVRKAPFDEEFVLPIDLDRQKLPDGVTRSYHQQTPVSQLLTKQFGELKKTEVFNSYFDKENAWRQINTDYLMSADELAIKLNTGVNNTSLVLAMEIGQTGEVLFFSGDAEFGVWDDWDKDRSSPDRVGKRQYTWTLPDHSDQTRPPRIVTVEDLMARTVFYKMGHHGSQNATPNTRGINKLSSPHLHSMIPVDHEKALSFGWDKIPFADLLTELNRRHVPHIRADEATDASIAEAQRLTNTNPMPSGATVAWSKDPTGNLYVDWKINLP
jgi:hypothetical protein